MLNLYSCGCTVAGDVPILSRCSEHNTFIVSALVDKVGKRRSFRVENKRIRHYPMREALESFNSKNIKFDLICGYPDHNPLHAYNALESGWSILRNTEFDDLYLALKSDGHMLLVVEQTVLSRTLYDALLAGFNLNSVSIVSSPTPILPLHKNWPEFYVYKFAILFSKNGSSVKLPDYMRLSKVHVKLRKLLQPKRLLELSCIHKPFLQIADENIGICEDLDRYTNLKRELC